MTAVLTTMMTAFTVHFAAGEACGRIAGARLGGIAAVSARGERA